MIPSLPAADDGFAGQRQVEEDLAELEGQGVFQSLAVDDQRKVIFFSQGVAQVWTVSCERGTSSLQDDKNTVRLWRFNLQTYISLLTGFLSLKPNLNKFEHFKWTHF